MRARRGLRLPATVAGALGAALVALLPLTATAWAPYHPVPHSGVGSVRAVTLGPSTLKAFCVAADGAGGDWVLADTYDSGWRLLDVAATGGIRTYPIASTLQVDDGEPACLAVTPNGDPWFGLSTGQIMRLDLATGRFQTFTVPGSDGYLLSLAAAPDGSLWVALNHINALAMITPSGSVSEYSLPSSLQNANQVTVMPDGSVWTNPCSCVPNSGPWKVLAELSPEGSLVRTVRLPHGDVQALLPGPAGELWVSYGDVPWGIAQVSPAGGVHVLPWNLFQFPTAMVQGRDGRLWFLSDNFGNTFGYYNSSTNTLTAFDAPGQTATVFAMAPGPGTSIAMTAADQNLYEIDTGIAAPASSSPVSTISSSLPTPAQAFGSAAAVVAGGAGAMGALLFITFPANLFNLTFKENYEEIRDWWRGVVKPLRRLRPKRRQPATAVNPPGQPAEVTKGEEGRARELASFGVVVVVGALLGSLLDPGFGSGIGSLYTFLAVVLAICAGAGIPAWVTWAYHRGRRNETTWHLRALPAGLAVAAACVLISRLVNFQPGYLYGVICGVAFGAKPTAAQKGHIVALSSMTTLVVSVLAWLAWVPEHAASNAANAAFAPVIVADFLAALFVSGLVGTVITLLPLRFLPGWDLHHWHLGAWSGCFGLATFGVVEVLLIPHTVNRSHEPLVTSLVLLVAFGGLSISLREFFARRRRRAEGRDHIPFRERVRELLSPVETPAAAAEERTEAPAPAPDPQPEGSM